MYPKSIDKFIEKLNKIDGNTYVIEEEVTLSDGVYEGELEHDNVSINSIRVYTGSKLTGEKIENFILSTPSKAPWKKEIKIFSDKPRVYITYETPGDTVEADDINTIQESIVNTQKTLNDERDRSEGVEQTIESNLNKEISRSKDVEKTLADNLNSETNRAKATEENLNSNINTEINRAKDVENNITVNLNNYKNSNNAEIQKLKEKDIDLDGHKAEKTYVDIELNKRYLKEQVFTKEEVLQKIKDVIGTAPEALDTLQEIAKALNNDADFAGTMTNELSKKVDKVVGKQLSTEDYTTAEKNKLAGVEEGANKYIHPSTHTGSMIIEDSTHRWTTDIEKANWNDTNSKKHTHGNLSLLETITQTIINTWNNAYTHISDAVKHITNDERAFWNTVSNKVDKVTGKGLSTNDFDNTYKAKVDGTSIEANKTEVSTTNGNIKIDGVEKAVYTHPSGTNPHGTTKSDVGLSNVDNTKQATKTEFDIHNGDTTKHITAAERTSWNSKVNANHTHDDRYYTEIEADSKFATKEDIGSAGYGNMLKSIYDKNNDGKVDMAEVADSVPWGGVTGKPATFNPSTHNHSISNVTGLQGVLDSKVSKGPVTWNGLKGV